MLPDGTGVTVCMHVRGLVSTTSSMVALLPADPAAPPRVWVAAGSPCVSIYVPALGVSGLPAELADPQYWAMGAALRDRVEEDGRMLAPIRALLGPIEAELWEEAESAWSRPGQRASFAASAGRRCLEATARACRAVGA